MSQYRRVAFLPDTFHEVNGVALTSRQLEAFARRRQIPFLSVHAGPKDETTSDGEVTIMQVMRGPASIPLDTHLDYDPFLWRRSNEVIAELEKFGAEVIHITGPGDMGVIGCYAAFRLKIPLVMSWHTSLHEYAGRRLERVLGFLGDRLSGMLGARVEKWCLDILGQFYRRAKVVLAPNQELVDMMRKLTNRPVFLMQRGVEADLFAPGRRTRTDSKFRIGYVGRLTPEKNVRLLADLGKALRSAGQTDFEFVIVGQGNEEDWLRDNVPNVKLTGVLKGERLAEAYANMDAFVFPSTTDTFGNVILEALASGVPAVVTSGGGPKFLVQSGVTGYVAEDAASLFGYVEGLMANRAMHARMGEAAREFARDLSWDNVFEKVFRTYEHCFDLTPTVAALPSAVKSKKAVAARRVVRTPL